MPYKITQNNNAPRHLSIPHPLAYTILCKSISNNWDDIDDSVIHLNYFLSILKMSLLQDSENMQLFHTFPILIVRRILDLKILKNTIQILKGMKNYDFQVLIFCQNFNKIELKTHVGSDLKIINLQIEVPITQKQIPQFL